LVLDDENPRDQLFGRQEAPENVKITDYLQCHENNGSVGCHQLGQLSTPHDSEVTTSMARHIRRVGYAASSRRRARTWSFSAAGQLGGMPFKYLGDWTDASQGRVAVCQAGRGRKVSNAHRRHAA